MGWVSSFSTRIFCWAWHRTMAHITRAPALTTPAYHVCAHTCVCTTVTVPADRDVQGVVGVGHLPLRIQVPGGCLCCCCVLVLPLLPAQSLLALPLVHPYAHITLNKSLHDCALLSCLHPADPALTHLQRAHSQPSEPSRPCALPTPTPIQFAHGREELRPVPRHPRWRTEPCRAFALTGTCSYGARCRFIHASSAPMALFGPPPGSSAAAIASLGMAGMMEGVGGWDEPLPPMLRSNTSATVLQHPNSNVGAAGMSLQMDTAPTPSHSAPQAFFNSRAAQVPPPGVDGGFSVVRHPHLTPGQQQAERLRRLFDRQDSGFAGGVSGMPVLSTVTEGVPSFMTAQQGGPWVRQQAALAAAAASNDVAGGARGSHDSSSASQYAPDMLELFASRGSLESLGARHASGVQGLFDLGSGGVVGPGLSHGFGSQSGHMAAAAGQSGAGAGLSYGPDGPYSAPLCKMRLQGDPMAPSLPFSAELWDNANLALLKIGSGSGNGSSWYTMQDAGAGANGRAASPAAPVHLHPASPRVGEGAQRLQAAAAAQAAQAAAQSQGAAAARSQAQAAAALQHQQHQAQQQQQQLGGAGPKGGRGGAAGGGSGSGSNPSGWGRLLNAIGGINRGAPRHS